MERQSLFISFEGGEGSGKTTQINKLAENLTNNGQKVITTREPGGTPEGEKARELLVQRDAGDWTPMAECLMMFAARVQHAQKIIVPALETNKVVITDRFVDSTMAYQGYGRGVDLAFIEQLTTLSLGNLKPDITFILDIDPEEGLARSERRMAEQALGVEQTEDRFEKMDIEFHRKIRQGFLEIAKKDPGRCHLIDATLDAKTITEKLVQIVAGKMG